MNKEELVQEITKTKEQLVKLQQALEEKEYERWKPSIDERFYYIDSSNSANTKFFDPDNLYDRNQLNTFNCFKTEAEAEAEAEKILVRRQLEAIARRLDKGNKLYWGHSSIRKYSLAYDGYYDQIDMSSTFGYKYQGTVYCSDKTFKDVAIQEIGLERLTKYLKDEY